MVLLREAATGEENHQHRGIWLSLLAMRAGTRLVENAVCDQLVGEIEGRQGGEGGLTGQEEGRAERVEEED